MGADMNAAPFTLEQAGHVAHLRFNRPHAANSMTPAFWRLFPEAVRNLDEAGQTRALVISGEGRHFCSGMDISAFSNGTLQPDDGAGAARRLRGDRPPPAGGLVQRGAGAVSGGGRHPGCLHRRRAGPGQRLRPALRGRRRLFPHRGNQYRHDGRCRQPAAPAQIAAGCGAAANGVFAAPRCAPNRRWCWGS